MIVSPTTGTENLQVSWREGVPHPLKLNLMESLEDKCFGRLDGATEVVVQLPRDISAKEMVLIPNSGTNPQNERGDIPLPEMVEVRDLVF